MRREGVRCSVFGVGGKRKKPEPATPASRERSTVYGPRSCEVSEDDKDWRLLTCQQFLRSYSDEDAIYDEYTRNRAR